MNKRSFPIGVILTFADGRLITTVEDMCEFANYMTGDSLFTHQLPRAFREIEPVLRKQFPWTDSPEFKAMQDDLTKRLEALGGAKGPPHRADDVRAEVALWLAECRLKFGAEHEVVPLAEWMSQDPISELVQMRESREGIVVIKIEQPEP